MSYRDRNMREETLIKFLCAMNIIDLSMIFNNNNAIGDTVDILMKELNIESNKIEYKFELSPSCNKMKFFLKHHKWPQNDGQMIKTGAIIHAFIKKTCTLACDRELDGSYYRINKKISFYIYQELVRLIYPALMEQFEGIKIQSHHHNKNKEQTTQIKYLKAQLNESKVQLNRSINQLDASTSIDIVKAQNEDLKAQNKDLKAQLNASKAPNEDLKASPKVINVQNKGSNDLLETTISDIMVYLKNNN